MSVQRYSLLAVPSACSFSKARKQILDLAKTYGLELSDLLSKGTAVRKPAEAKYRHPDDANVTW